MSAVFEFDEADLAITHADRSDDEAHCAGESGYSSEDDAPEPTPILADERLYEVPLAEDYISSSVKNAPLKRKACKDDFDVLKVLGRGA